MTKVGVVGSSTECLLSQLRVITFMSWDNLMNVSFYNSRSGASPLSLHHPSQKVNSTVKSKIRKDKRKVKDVITGTRTQVSPPPSQKRYRQCEFPPGSKALRVIGARVLGLASLTIVQKLFRSAKPEKLENHNSFAQKTEYWGGVLNQNHRC